MQQPRIEVTVDDAIIASQVRQIFEMQHLIRDLQARLQELEKKTAITPETIQEDQQGS